MEPAPKAKPEKSPHTPRIWTYNRQQWHSVESQRSTSGTSGITPFRSAMSQDRRIRLGYTVSPRLPHAAALQYLTGPGTGHQWWWLREDATVVEKSFLEDYGGVVRWNGSLGVHRPLSKYYMFIALILSYRTSACGSQTPKLSTIFSKVLATCTRDRATSRKYLSLSLTKALFQSRVCFPPYLM